MTDERRILLLAVADLVQRRRENLERCERRMDLILSLPMSHTADDLYQAQIRIAEGIQDLNFTCAMFEWMREQPDLP